MRVDDIFKQAKQAGALPVSFEMFPPKGDLTMEKAREVAGSWAELHPDFISVTYSAGGSGNKGATANIAHMITDELGIPSVAHLTCISLTREGLKEKIEDFRAHGIRNVLALRGDVPHDASNTPDTPDFHYAKDIIPQLVDAGFCVGAAAYTEGHIECGASLPSPVIKLLARYENDPDSLRAAGIEYACRQLENLRDHGAEGLHVYAMNRPSVARACMSAIRGA